MTQVFNNDTESLMTFNTSDTPPKCTVSNQETETKILNHIHIRYWIGIGFLLYPVKNPQS